MPETSGISRVEKKRKKARERILETAERIFIMEGSYRKTTIREIARRADVSVGSVYLHFPTKGDILAALTAEHAASIKRRLIAAIPPAGSGREKLEALLGFMDELRGDKSFELYGRFAASQFDQSIDAVMRDVIRREVSVFYDVVADVLRACREDGLLREGFDVRLVSITFMTIAMSFTRDLLSADKPVSASFLFPEDADAVFGVFTGMIRHALCSDAAVAPSRGSA